MSTNKHIDKICIAVIAITLVISILFSFGSSLGITASAKTMPYEKTLFDTSYVHTIDIVMNDWDDFIENCESEEYSSCTVVVDGEKYSNIAIRAKGNTSLSTVSTLGSQRYSFKLEFDHYDSSKTLDGLDKLCLNNLIQDNTMMKDYLVYQMMNDFGVDSPLCSYAYLTVNGEDWGLYLAVEGIEDSFLARNYDSADGDLYKPDSISFGGGRGNGKGFNMDDFDFDSILSDEKETQTDNQTVEQDRNQSANQWGNPGENQGGFPGGQFSFGNMPDMSGMPNFSGNAGDFSFGDQTEKSDQTGDFSAFAGGMSFGMGSDDVKLKYIDDNADSYSNIFESAKTTVTAADKKRLINSLKNLSNYSNLENTVDIEEVIRYFVVHNFVCNGDSYTGSMIHNYYLYEEDGILSMIPWDYNLAYGTFQGGNASETINTSIDSPISGGNVDDRPMLGWIFSSEEYVAQYHELFTEFINKWFTNGELAQMISETAEMLRPYVEKDPTKFCTLEEFDAGVVAISEFVSLRAEAVENQLNGDDTKVDTSSLNISDMGTMGGNMGGIGGDMPTMPSGESGNTFTMPDGQQDGSAFTMPDGQQDGSAFTMPDGQQDGSAFTMPDGQQDGSTFTMPDMSQNGSMPTMPDMSQNGSMPTMPGMTQSGNMPTMPDMSQNGNMPSMMNGNGANFDFSSMGNLNNANNFANGNSETTQWIAIGASFLVLAAGILIAVKKKY